MSLKIRPEKPGEFGFLFNLVKVAFETAKVSNGDEQNYVDRLRASSGYLPELALVAEWDNEIVGHIMLTKTYVLTGTQRFEGLVLAPLSVALPYRRRGIGSKLVQESFRIAKVLGYQAVFVVGDPAYYGRFGFKSSAKFGIRHVPEIPEPYVMAIELTPNALAGISGTVNFT
ncbi:MAG TPA: N-acetyltransferase [Candidatus Acidoferrales bacterium]|nr:N-acetyltransferase [Candidatus Acidoferrales bacterium]